MIPDSAAELAGQAILAGFSGHQPPPELVSAARRGWLGGWVLFGRNLGTPEAIAGLCAQLRGASGASGAALPPPWIAVDQEGGRVQRLRAPAVPVVQLPPARALGLADDTTLTEDAATALGLGLRALGFNLDFAPVVDVDTNPANPVIGDRSFGADAERVARHGLAFARGLVRAGVAPCAKHFPGHGDTVVDSHLALPRLSHPRERLERVELAPFRGLVEHVPAVMTAHVVFDALDPGVPATLSRRVVSALLREAIGFGGVVFTDDLEMRAIADGWGVGEAACLAIEAGCDTVLVCSRPDWVLEAHAALTRRAELRPAFLRRLRESCARSFAARRRFALAPVAPPEARAALERLAPEALAARLASATAGAEPPARA
jgi:beta-N-acetylhexosaminidase